MTANSVSFTPLASAHAKFVMMGPPGVLSRRIVDSVRSLNNFEHVAPSSGSDAPDLSPAWVRHWFFGRKRSHGFLLQGFPKVRQHAILLDEWLDARDETLTGCLWLDLSPETVPAESADDSKIEISTWFDNHAANTANVADFYESRGQLFRFDAASASFEEVAELAHGITADR